MNGWRPDSFFWPSFGLMWPLGMHPQNGDCPRASLETTFSKRDPPKKTDTHMLVLVVPSHPFRLVGFQLV